MSNGKHFPDVFDECAFSIFKTKHSYFGRQTMGMDAALSCATPITSPVGTANARRTQNFKSSINAARIILKCRRNPPPDSPPTTRKLPSTDLIIVCVVVKCVLLSSYVYLLYYVCIAVLTLDAGLLARSQYPERPATGHLDTGFSWFPCCLQANAQMVPKFPSRYYMPLM